MRQLLKRNFNAQIASGNHDSVAGFTDLIDMVNTGLILDLCNQIDIGRIVFIKNSLNIQQILLH